MRTHKIPIWEIDSTHILQVVGTMEREKELLLEAYKNKYRITSCKKCFVNNEKHNQYGTLIWLLLHRKPPENDVI